MTIARLWQPFRFQGRDTSTRGLLKKSLGGPAGEKKKNAGIPIPINRQAPDSLPVPFFFHFFNFHVFFYLGTSHATKRELPLDKLKRCLVAPTEFQIGFSGDREHSAGFTQVAWLAATAG